MLTKESGGNSTEDSMFLFFITPTHAKKNSVSLAKLQWHNFPFLVLQAGHWARKWNPCIQPDNPRTNYTAPVESLPHVKLKITIG